MFQYLTPISASDRGQISLMLYHLIIFFVKYSQLIFCQTPFFPKIGILVLTHVVTLSTAAATTTSTTIATTTTTTATTTTAVQSGTVTHINYVINENLEWPVTTSCQSVKVVSTIFDTETTYDYLTLDGVQYSGNNGIDITVPTGNFVIYFQSDGSVVGGGFDLTWTCIGNLCPSRSYSCHMVVAVFPWKLIFIFKSMLKNEREPSKLVNYYKKSLMQKNLLSNYPSPYYIFIF